MSLLYSSKSLQHIKLRSSVKNAILKFCETVVFTRFAPGSWLSSADILCFLKKSSARQDAAAAEAELTHAAIQTSTKHLMVTGTQYGHRIRNTHEINGVPQTRARAATSVRIP
ncbi:unnamed protein product [Colias eurytheme]|nr:unnamed protein product [Colias eurytheme]